MNLSENDATSVEQKIFDPRDTLTNPQGAELLDATVCQRGDQWWLYLAGQTRENPATDIFSASLPPGARLSAVGWKPTIDREGRLIPAASHKNSEPWDGKGGRHCPSWVTGVDPATGQTVERIYYAGASEHLWGPYAIGFLQWDGTAWTDRAEPVFVAGEEWERGSVFEPNLLYHDGKWKMWYVAGSNHEDYIVHGYAESADGISGWSKHVIFAPQEMKMFDFCVRRFAGAFHAVFARVWLREGAPPEDTGLWWCTADKPSARLSDWRRPVQILTAEDRSWHAGPWKPSFILEEGPDQRLRVFFNGSYRTDDPGPFPFAFTLGCLERVCR
jgi:hypothetical protein